MISIPEREGQFNALFKKVSDQARECAKLHPVLGMVQIVKIVTPRVTDGGPSIGKKRQMGLEQAKGAYVCWLDDDDDISPDYVETILRLAYNSNADVLTFSSFIRFDTFWCVVRMSLFFKKDDQVMPGIVKRRPYHVCAWRTRTALQVKFKDINWDEDTAFIKELIPLCRLESRSQAIIHEYNRTTKSFAEETMK